MKAALSARSSCSFPTRSRESSPRICSLRPTAPAAFWPTNCVVANGAVRNLIRENQLHQLENSIQTGRREGMVLMDNCLYDLYCKCLITYETAVSRARHPDRIIPQK